MNFENEEPTLLYASPEEDLWVMNKPAHYLTHPDGSGRLDLLSYCAQADHLNLPPSLYPIHRLDLETSGILCLSSSGEGVQYWQNFWQNHQIEKRYIGLVKGKMRPKGIIRRSLKDQRRKKSLEATTRYRTLWYFEGCSLVELRPQEGRKHQIRRHLNTLGYGLSGEQRYRVHGRAVKVSGAPARLWLHASRLKLSSSEHEYSWKAPLPKELKTHLLTLGGEEIVSRLEEAKS